MKQMLPILLRPGLRSLRTSLLLPSIYQSKQITRPVRLEERRNGLYLLMGEVASIHIQGGKGSVLAIFGDCLPYCDSWVIFDAVHGNSLNSKCLKSILMCVFYWLFLWSKQTLQPTLQRKGISHFWSMSVPALWENGLNFTIYQYQSKLFILDLLCAKNLCLGI